MSPGMVRTTLRLPSDLMREVRVIAAERGMTLSALVRGWLEDYVASLEAAEDDQAQNTSHR